MPQSSSEPWYYDYHHYNYYYSLGVLLLVVFILVEVGASAGGRRVARPIQFLCDLFLCNRRTQSLHYVCIVLYYVA